MNGTIQTAKEIQALLREVRQDPVSLRLWRIPEVEHWQDMVVLPQLTRLMRIVLKVDQLVAT